MLADSNTSFMTSKSSIRDVLSKRYAVLSLLIEQPRTKPELVDNLDCSRATVDRAINELLDTRCVQLVETTSRRYEATQTGVIAAETHSNYRDTIDALDEAWTALNPLPADATVAPKFLRGADVYSPPDPARQPSQEIFRDCTNFYGTAPAVFKAYFDSHLQKLQDDEFDSEIIFQADVVEEIQNRYSTQFEKLAAFDSMSLFVVERQLPYALWLMELESRTVGGITTYESGNIKGIIINDSPEAIQWVRTEYQQYKNRSTPLAAPSE